MRRSRQLSIFILLLAASFALYGGILLIKDPSGESAHFPFYLLHGTIFSDYHRPAWILTLLVGASSLFIIVMILFNAGWYPILVMLQGFIICVFDFIMMILLPETFPIEYLYLLIGILLIVLGVSQYQQKMIDHARKRSASKK